MISNCTLLKNGNFSIIEALQTELSYLILAQLVGNPHEISATVLNFHIFLLAYWNLEMLNEIGNTRLRLETPLSQN